MSECSGDRLEHSISVFRQKNKNNANQCVEVQADSCLGNPYRNFADFYHVEADICFS